jgi:hypothetical protein
MMAVVAALGPESDDRVRLQGAIAGAIREQFDSGLP